MQRWLFQIFGLALLIYGVGCSVDTPTYTPDDSTPTPGTTSSCAPKLSGLKFYQTEVEGVGLAIKVNFKYELRCDGEIDGSVLRVKLTDKDAQENGGKNYTSIYDFPIDLDLTDKTVFIDTTTESGYLKYAVADSQTTTTYEFELRLVDSNGYVGEEIDDTAVYVDLDPDPDP